MRNANLAVLFLLAAGSATMAGPTPAAAYDYPYCVQGRGVGIPGDCSYQTYQQCMASAAGRGVYCSVNPRAALNQQPRRGRVYRDY
ncbi:DUF3551 domain-containing protein [Bradyrhizobium sp. AUGA SZCCT0160]|uniref:DUF3551 domain-containing protein n=1 Tax=Bradyrhizobium sp. AUGA SZCCT0160 TaxID=2807662 RepID=UPI001BADE6F6|nr:DUF3551 domain-containing protein [Bradyrhizobium sp. AUGA SZCCT0160]MBR1189404.1 DUF3551 domain-containing protein [Bradyrhizobium sp. AUGA SZCCT0160]